MQAHQPNQLMLIGIGVLVLAIFAFRMSRMRQARPLRIEWLWVTPAIMIAAVGFMIWGLGQQHQTLEGMDWAWMALMLVIGAAIGWYRGRMMKIEVNPETHALNQQASPAAIIFIVALLVVRRAADYFLQGEAKAWHIDLALLTAAPVVLVVGMLTATRVEMFIRARRMLSEAKRGAAIAA